MTLAQRYPNNEPRVLTEDGLSAEGLTILEKEPDQLSILTGHFVGTYQVIWTENQKGQIEQHFLKVV